jgi:hypothetical protein
MLTIDSDVSSSNQDGVFDALSQGYRFSLLFPDKQACMESDPGDVFLYLL